MSRRAVSATIPRACALLALTLLTCVCLRLHPSELYGHKLDQVIQVLMRYIVVYLVKAENNNKNKILGKRRSAPVSRPAVELINKTLIQLTLPSRGEILCGMGREGFGWLPISNDLRQVWAAGGPTDDWQM
jgi:hypothetical protein